MKQLIIILFPCFLQAQTVEVKGYLKIDSVKTGVQTDSLLVIKNSEIKKVLGTFIIMHMHDAEMMKMINPTDGLLVYDLDLHKLFIFMGSNWEMINSMAKFQ